MAGRARKSSISKTSAARLDVAIAAGLQAGAKNSTESAASREKEYGGDKQFNVAANAGVVKSSARRRKPAR